MNILIADSGGSGTSWIWTNNDSSKEFYSASWHPTNISDQLIQETKIKLEEVLPKTDVLYFYGAGASSQYELIKSRLSEVFNGITLIQSDLMGACISTLRDNDGYCAILGTGAIACEYNDGEITRTTSGRGHILGDEGSGYDIGKRAIIIALEYPDSIIGQTLTKHHSQKELEEFIDNKDKFHVASIVKYLAEKKNEPEIQHVLNEAFEEFFETAVQPLAEEGELDLVGSIAYYFQNEIENVLARYNWKIKTIIQNPIHKLAQYHSEQLQNI